MAIQEGKITHSMTTKSTRLGKLKLPARTVFSDGEYLSKIDNLKMIGKGDSPEESQNDLIEKFIAWIQISDVQENLEIALEEAGFMNVAKGTQLELEFIG